MMTNELTFETLSIRHLELLLSFELENKAWFESFIAPREASFYSEEGVRAHITDAISNMESGTHFSGLLMVNNKVVARGNLKAIDSTTRECAVGYRVAKHCTGKGFASYCLNALIQKAMNEFTIKTIKADVLDNNPASKAVLEKQGFSAKTYQYNFTKLNGVPIACTTYERSIK